MLSVRSVLGSQLSSKWLPLQCLCYSSSAAAVEAERTVREGPRNDWTKPQIKSIYDSPVLDLLFHGAQVHRHAHNFREVQQCTLLSIKTGGCSEDCSYCPQSSRYDTGLKAQKLMNKDAVIQAAQKAKEAGSTRFCMGAAWRDTIGRKTNFNNILEYVKEIREMGMENITQISSLRRSYDERLETLKHVREAGINVCSGGIIGLGEAEEDRVGLLHTLATLPTHPESVPINALLAVKGTPLQDQKPVEIWEMVRMIATARIVMPKAMVRLSAGRVRFSMPEQALCFLAGANSIFTGEKLLTTPNNDFDADQLMFKILGLTPKAPSFSEDETSASEAENCEEATPFLESSPLPAKISLGNSSYSLVGLPPFSPSVNPFNTKIEKSMNKFSSSETIGSGSRFKAIWDKWWHKKLQVHSTAAKFRKKGIDSAMMEKLDRMFMNTTATGDHAWAPSSGVLPSDSSNNDIIQVESIADSDESMPFEITQNVASVEKGRTTSMLDKCNNTLGVRDGIRKGKNIVARGRRKVKTSVKSPEHIDGMLNTINTESVAASQMQNDTVCSITGAMQKLVSMTWLKPSNELWLFASRLFLMKDKREVFSLLEEAEDMLTWLRYEKEHSLHS
ncbi:hypothetical protein QYF36_001145 [Acer negundo]|nr:hypothetical protein QYF36_001145 [Acer negundo]